MIDFKSIPDEQLPELFKSSEQKQRVFLEIVGRFKEKIYFHVRRILPNHEDADDAAQLTFIKVWQNLPDFRGDSKFYSWIYRIATNEALTLLRKNKQWDGADDVHSALAAEQSEPDLPKGAEIESLLMEAIEILPKKQQLVFNLKYFEEFSYDDIANITGTSVGALKASYFHAVKKIEDHFLKSKLNQS